MQQPSSSPPAQPPPEATTAEPSPAPTPTPAPASVSRPQAAAASMPGEPALTAAQKALRSKPARSPEDPEKKQNKKLKDVEISFPIVYGSISFWLGKKASEYHSYKWTVFIRSATNEDLRNRLLSCPRLDGESLNGRAFVACRRWGSRTICPTSSATACCYCRWRSPLSLRPVASPWTCTRCPGWTGSPRSTSFRYKARIRCSRKYAYLNFRQTSDLGHAEKDFDELNFRVKGENSRTRHLLGR